jgi:methyl-accepting chemotaxis protein
MHFVAARLRRQLIAAFAVVAGVFLIALLVGYSNVGAIGDKVRSGESQLDVLASASGAARDLQGSEVRTILDPTRAKDHLADMDTFQGTVTALNRLGHSAQSRAALADLASDFTAFRALDARVVNLARAHQVAAATALANGAANDAADKLVEAVSTAAAAVSHDHSNDATGMANSARTLMIVLAVVALLIAAAISITFSGRLTKRIRRLLDGMGHLDQDCITPLTDGLEAIAAGDLTHHIAPDVKPIERQGVDELAELTDGFNAMAEKAQASAAAYNTTRTQVAEMLRDIGVTSDQLAAASTQMAQTSDEAGRAVNEIAHAVDAVAEGAEDQVRSISEAKHLTANVAAASHQSAEGAGQTRDAAEEARTIAAEGVAAVSEATEAMRAVRDASEETTAAIRALGAKSGQIGGIVDTITGIAEQTNLLALNAAIEAARVGEQGRGFAVVAEEVRKLAEESQSAASTIAELITEIQQETQRAVDVVEEGSARTEGGVVTVERAKDAFVRISDSVSDMSTRVEQIAAGIEQIAAAGRDMEQSISQVAAVAEESSASSQQVSASTQQTTASTERVAASAGELAHTAEQLEQMVARFTLK